MFLYIDALFKVKDSCPQSSAFEGWGLLNADTNGIRNIPPYMLDPTAVMVVNSNGGLEVFDNPEPAILLADLGEYLEAAPLTGNEACVGWYLDQVVIPVLCAGSMTHGVKSVIRWMRRLDDKWAKTMGFSVERAFVQGWYPSSKEVDNSDLTLDLALNLSGMPSLSDLAEEQQKDEVLKPEHVMLMTRILAINKLYTRYQFVTSREVI